MYIGVANRVLAQTVQLELAFERLVSFREGGMHMDQVIAFLPQLAPALELGSYLSQVIIAIAAILALRQIVILKRALRVNSTRDALRITSEQCVVYIAEIIPLQNTLNDEIKDKDVKYFEGWNVEIKNGKIVVSREEEANTEGLMEVLHEFEVFNNMEAFSLFFTSKVCDEKIAYDTVGVTFLMFTREFLPWLLSCRKAGHYKNLIKLFVQWESRRLSEEIKSKKLTLDEQLKATTFDYSPPIGTEFK